MGREAIQNCMTRKQKCSNILGGIRVRHPGCEEAKHEREDEGWSFKLKKYL